MLGIVSPLQHQADEFGAYVALNCLVVTLAECRVIRPHIMSATTSGDVV